MRKDSLQNKTSWELQAAAETHRFLHPLLAACAVITCDPTMRLAVAVLVFVGSVVAAARAANLRTDRDVAPQLTPATYDVAMSTRLMHMCAAAYCPTGIGNWTCNACVEAGFNVTTIATESTWELLAYVGYDPTADAVVVAFRGSSNLPNWILDLWAVSGMCHALDAPMSSYVPLCVADANAYEVSPLQLRSGVWILQSTWCAASVSLRVALNTHAVCPDFAIPRGVEGTNHCSRS